MSFTSLEFLAFFAVLLLLYWRARTTRLQNLLLLAGSYLFYGWVDPWLAGFLALFTAADYALTRPLTRPTARRRAWLAASLALNLGLLGAFKYFNFFSAGIAAALAVLGVSGDPLILAWAAPVGLSFYAFKKISYALDLYRGSGPAAPGLLDYAVFVTFFPQIASGPIQRARSLLPQIAARRDWNSAYLDLAWPLAVWGLFKKLVIAAPVAVIVEKVFALQQPSLGVLWAGGLAFTLLVLVDFSAYTDLSRAAAYLLGFDTPENFRAPYLALTPGEFWNRWHITLSEWLRDYVFYPLRRAALRRAGTPAAWSVWLLPPLLTFLVSGLWHGAGWNYVLWGGYYGVLIALYQRAGWGAAWRPRGPVRALLAWLLMFSLTVAGWILFRAPSLGWLWRVLTGSPLLFGRADAVSILVSLGLLAAYSVPLALNHLIHRYTRAPSWARALFLAAALAVTLIYIRATTQDFIYFQF